MRLLRINGISTRRLRLVNHLFMEAARVTPTDSTAKDNAKPNARACSKRRKSVSKRMSESA